MADCVSVRVHFCQTLGVSNSRTAQRRANDFRLCVVFHCASDKPSTNILRNPATFDWRPIVKIEHYRVKVDSIKHPVDPQKDTGKYKLDGDRT